MHNRKISVVGLGYVGLPVAVAFGKQEQVIGFDINPQRILELIQGYDKTYEVSKEELESTNILFTCDVEELKKADFHIVAVPTPVDEAHVPDLTPVEKSSETVGKALKKGDIVVYESTVYPGVTEEICVPILERMSSLRCGKDFTVGYSPERINPGDKERSFTNILKIVSGQDQRTLDIVSEVYSSVVKSGVYKAASIKVAEAAKVIENSQRDLNIAFMNELSIVFARMGIDTLDVLEAAGTKWNFLPFRPGLVGGHCIGVDPYYLTYKAEKFGYAPQVIHSGRRINDNMGRYIAKQGIKQLLKRSIEINKVHANVLGFTFKEDCPDVRNTRVIDLINELIDYNVDVTVCDPVADATDTEHEYGIKFKEFDKLSPAPLMVLAVAHKEFKNLNLDRLLSKVQPGGVILDVKGILPRSEVTSRGYALWRL
ncbi:MAG TPA: nucleotide sugar dehydrogenase [Lentisphaeria bacterium]|nr:MAG: GDP-mannose dehydrogenase [Lentisphaerae bacterium GWF2_38_69]HBM16701.1 nucleotide sugar dehydrogenase [Lentisphaeria bacterium]